MSTFYKCDGLSELVAFAKIEVFYRLEWTKGVPHQNEFWLFSNIKMNVINRAQKVNEENGVICLVSKLPSWVMVFVQKRTFFTIVCWPQQEM